MHGDEEGGIFAGMKRADAVQQRYDAVWRPKFRPRREA
jgi:hypothetical protein